MDTFSEYEKALRSGNYKKTDSNVHEPYIHPESEAIYNDKKTTKPWDLNASKKSILYVILSIIGAISAIYFVKTTPDERIQIDANQFNVPDIIKLQGDKGLTKEISSPPNWKLQQQQALAQIDAWERIVRKAIDGHFKALDKGQGSIVCITYRGIDDCFSKVSPNTRPAIDLN